MFPSGNMSWSTYSNRWGKNSHFFQLKEVLCLKKIRHTHSNKMRSKNRDVAQSIISSIRVLEPATCIKLQFAIFAFTVVPPPSIGMTGSLPGILYSGSSSRFGNTKFRHVSS